METFSALLAICAENSPVPVNSPHKGQWRGALMFYSICARINGWANNGGAGDLRRHRAHYDVIVMNRFHFMTSSYSDHNTTVVYSKWFGFFNRVDFSDCFHLLCLWKYIYYIYICVCVFKYMLQHVMILPLIHSAPTGARNSSLGHPNMAEASLGKNFPNVIPSLLHIFSGWYLQGLVIWCVSLSRPQNVLCKRRHIARPGDYISLGDAWISTNGCPNLPRLNKPGCPKLRQDARIWVKMSESRSTIRCRDRWLNNCFISDGEDDYICCESSAQPYS